MFSIDINFVWHFQIYFLPKTAMVRFFLYTEPCGDVSCNGKACFLAHQECQRPHRKNKQTKPWKNPKPTPTNYQERKKSKDRETEKDISRYKKRNGFKLARGKLLNVEKQKMELYETISVKCVTPTAQSLSSSCSFYWDRCNSWFYALEVASSVQGKRFIVCSGYNGMRGTGCQKGLWFEEGAFGLVGGVFLLWLEFTRQVVWCTGQW